MSVKDYAAHFWNGQYYTEYLGLKLDLESALIAAAGTEKARCSTGYAATSIHTTW